MKKLILSLITLTGVLSLQAANMVTQPGPMILRPAGMPGTVVIKDAKGNPIAQYQRMGVTPDGYNFGTFTSLVVESGKGTPANTNNPNAFASFANPNYTPGLLGSPANISLYQYVLPQQPTSGAPMLLQKIAPSDQYPM